MLNNLTNRPPIPNNRLDLLRNRTLRIIILLARARNININSRTLTRKNLRRQTVLAEIERSAIHLIEHNSRQAPKNLHLELWRLDDVDRRDEAVDDEGDAGGGIDGYGVCLSQDP